MKKFFAAANTENGFFSLFDEIFAPEKFRRIYILKGGPGTGKSTLMRKIADAAQSKGYDVEYIYCSSDPDSLDGIIISALSVAILDGTSPHMTDPVYPGAVERIVDLGVAFDFRMLEQRRDELIPLIRAKKESYRTGYRFLSVAGRIEREYDTLLRDVYLAEKADAAAKRLIAHLHGHGICKEEKRYISAICGKGFPRLDTLSKYAKKIYAVTDKNGAGYLFMNTLYENLCAVGFSMTWCPCPLTGERKEAIFLHEEGILFTVVKEDEVVSADKIINSARFVDKDGFAKKRCRLRFIEKCKGSMLESGTACFAEAGKAHMESEHIYGACVDFLKIEGIMGKISAEIFANNV